MVTFDKRLQEELKQQNEEEQDKPITIETTRTNSLKQVLQWIGKPAIIKACMSIVLLIVTVILILIADKFIIEFCALKITQFVVYSKNIVVCLLALFCGTIFTFGLTVLGSICIVVKVANFVMDGPLCVILGTFDTPEECIQSIDQWWEDNHFKPAYIHMWYTNNSLVIDYGNHLGFYVIKGINDER